MKVMWSRYNSFQTEINKHTLENTYIDRAHTEGEGAWENWFSEKVKLHGNFDYRHFRLVKILKVTLFDTLYDFIIWYAACVK